MSVERCIFLQDASTFSIAEIGVATRPADANKKAITVGDQNRDRLKSAIFMPQVSRGPIAILVFGCRRCQLCWDLHNTGQGYFLGVGQIPCRRVDYIVGYLFRVGDGLLRSASGPLDPDRLRVEPLRGDKLFGYFFSRSVLPRPLVTVTLPLPPTRWVGPSLPALQSATSPLSELACATDVLVCTGLYMRIHELEDFMKSISISVMSRMVNMGFTIS
jgi:hypothetical protein